MRAFLSYRGVINHQHRIVAADEPIGLDEQLSFQGSGIPDPCGDEVVQLIVVTRCKPLRHRLNAFAVPRTLPRQLHASTLTLNTVVNHAAPLLPPYQSSRPLVIRAPGHENKYGK